jgi:formylglycine-generating enzyme required for sulfatase activity
MSTTDKRPLKVFLCHAHADRIAVRALYLRLKREGVDAWLDKEKLLPGADWELEIRKAVGETDVVVVCLSKQFNQAGFRQKEVRIALDTAMEQPEGEIFIIPARLEECENLESLRKWHWVDLFEEDGHQNLIRALRARAERIGATLRIRRGGQSSISRSRGKEPEKTAEPPGNDLVIGDSVSGNMILTLIPESQKFEEDEKVIREKAALDKKEVEAAEAKHEEAKREGAERSSPEKEELEVAAKLAQEKIEKEYQRKHEKIIRDARRKKFLIAVRYRLTLVRLYALPILLGFLAIALLVYVFFYMSQNISPIPTQALTSRPTFALQPSLTATEAFASTEIGIPSSTATKLFTLTPALGIGSTMISEKDDMVMVYVPEGAFTMGSDSGDNNERPAHNVFLDNFWIDRTEVTHSQFTECVKAGVCGLPLYVGGYARDYYFEDKFADYPIILVSWEIANSYCEWVDRRLPTEAEWEKAARGTDGRIYPWGNEAPNCSLANIPDCVSLNLSQSPLYALSPVGSYTEGQSPYGALDMIGNVQEWVADWYDEIYYSASPDKNPLGPDAGRHRVARGGSDHQIANAISRTWALPDYKFYSNLSSHTGFRCAQDANP